MTMFPMLPMIKASVKLGVTLPPSPTFSLGGLHVDISQRVLREESLEPIPGLYAAGRSAAGVATGGYVSGLSIADAVFAGRRAARHAMLGVADAKAAAEFYTGSLAAHRESEVPIASKL
jgi:3-oxo-5alpha-steroid 4-dehydrogenase